MMTTSIDIHDYFSSERNALLRLLDQHLKEKELSVSHWIPEHAMQKDKEYFNMLKKNMQKLLLEELLVELINDNAFHYEEHKDKISGDVELKMSLNVSFMLHKEGLRSQIEEAIEELTKYHEDL